MKKEIYLDNAAAAPVDAKVQKKMNKAMKLAGNPSSYNDAGRRAAQELHSARVTVARFLGARPEEIVFTGSGSEANNLALSGAAYGAGVRNGHIVTTPIEHPSVLEPVKKLAADGFKATYLKVDREGMIDPESVMAALTGRTVLVSVMYANNEVGTIEPVARIGKLIRQWRNRKQSRFPLFHVDACQAAGYLDMDVNRLGADMVTFNGSKIYGPRGIGVLYVRQGTELQSQVLGGSQEHGLRAGTENVPAAAGLAEAIRLLDRKEAERLSALRDFFLDGILKVLPEARLNGAAGNRRLANNVNVSLPGLESEQLLIELDRHGIRAGSGSACTARSVEPSHVLKAIGVSRPYLDGALRFTLGRVTTGDDLARVLKILPAVVRELKERYAR